MLKKVYKYKLYDLLEYKVTHKYVFIEKRKV